ncbi:MAG: hypothetical protein FWC43_04850 [Planctomycetaceae bacterium]|nr:hypothetical protein [Planctomycetaceae bacterium]
MLTIQSRSRLVAERVFVVNMPALQTITTAFDRVQKDLDSVRAEVEEMRKLAVSPCETQTE